MPLAVAGRRCVAILHTRGESEMVIPGLQAHIHNGPIPPELVTLDLAVGASWRFPGDFY